MDARPESEVTICIPAYQAAEFIDRTLDCAQAQTYAALRIVVSVDRSTDATEQICRARSNVDPRIEVHAHAERLGWAANVNYLLDAVETEFAFLYFHDDVIEPTYVERLVGALRSRPDAASANCDMGLFGGSDHTLAGRSYDGSPTERLLAYLVVTAKGSLLRSMLRTELVRGDVRLPTGSDEGVWANHAFVMRLVAAGPAVHIDETLYHRWTKRGGGLTDGWRALPFESILQGDRTNARDALELVDGLGPSPTERESLLLALWIYFTRMLRTHERAHDVASVTPAELVLPELASIDPASALSLPDPLRTWCEEGYDIAQRNTARRAREVGDHALEVSTWEDLVCRNPDAPAYRAKLDAARRRRR